MGRKTWLFIGSITAGRRAPNSIALGSSALHSDLAVWIYMKSLLDAPLSGSPTTPLSASTSGRSHTLSTSVATEWRNAATEPTASSVSESPAEPPKSPAPNIPQRPCCAFTNN